LFNKLFDRPRRDQLALSSRKSLASVGRAEFISPTDGSRVRGDYTAWTVIPRPHLEIVRTYQFWGLSPPNSYQRMEVRCRPTKSIGGKSNGSPRPLIYFVVEPRICKEEGFLAALFAPHDSDSQHGGIVLRVETTATANQLYVLYDCADRCLDVLLAAKPIVVRFMSPQGVFACFLLENDRSFGEAYTRCSNL
jgi:hypothetical protein